MRLVTVFGLLFILFMFVGAAAAYSVPDKNLESEQRIASMELNQSAGNMTGDDYVIALINAYMQDVQNDSSKWMYPGPIFRSIEEEALLKFPEYENVYMLLDNGRGSIDTHLMGMLLVPPNFVTGRKCENMSEVPESNIIGVVQYVFSGNEDVINKARETYQKRIAQETELKAVKEKREAEQLRLQQEMDAQQLLERQENEARQRALDAHYNGIFENYSMEIDTLLNQSDFDEALNRTNESIELLVSPYRNIMQIKRGDIYSRIGSIGDNHTNALMYINAMNDYKTAQTDFTYSNETAEYKDSVNQSFVENKWDRIAEMKEGIAGENFEGELIAMAANLRNAPNAKQLLSDRVHNVKYSITVANYTDPLFGMLGYSGYWVQVNISAYNDLNKIDGGEYLTANIPIFIDIFAALFSNEKISKVIIQLNESYYDKFGHTLERPFMKARLDNMTATQIGDWGVFKKYIGTDRSKFEQVVDLRAE